MSDTTEAQPYWGFELDSDTVAEVSRILARIESAKSDSEETRSLAKDAARGVRLLTAAGFESYYRQPSDMVALSPKVKKTIDSGVRGIEKAIAFVTDTFFKARTLDELQSLAVYLKAMLHSKSSETPIHLVFPISGKLYQRAIDLFHRLRHEEQLGTIREDATETLSALVGESIEAYYVQPTAMVDIGKMTRKTADMSVRGVSSGIRSLIGRLVKQLDDDELRTLAVYLESMLHEK